LPHRKENHTKRFEATSFSASCKVSLPAARRHICDRPQLYWSAPVTEKEARYLTALLDSETARQRGESLQSRGHARDFDKVMFNLPIPRFDSADSLHNAVAGAACAAEVIAASVPLPENTKFQRARGLVRAALTGAGVAQRIDALVASLLDGA
jgi:hypothetical protein